MSGPGISGEVASRYAGAMLLHAFGGRAGAGEILAAAAGGDWRPGDVALLSAVSICFALGAATIEQFKHLTAAAAGPLAGLAALPELRTLRPRLAAIADHTNPVALQRLFAQAMLAAAERDLAALLADPAITPAAKNARLIPAAREKITAARKKLDAVASARDKIPAKLPANIIDPDAKVALLRTRRRGLQMVLRLLAHNAEHWLASHLNVYLRDDDEYRALTRQTIIRGLAGTITYTPPAGSPSPSSSPARPASPAALHCSSTRSTTTRPPCPATSGPSPTSSPAGPNYLKPDLQHVPEIWGAPGSTGTKEEM